MSAPGPDNHYLAGHVARLLESYRHWTGRYLLTPAPAPGETARRLYHAPFAVLSHGPGEDPCFDYGNLRAQELFELPWDELVRLPSRRSAEPVDQASRAELLARVARDGYIDDYSGVRVSASGRRFRIEQAVVWNLLDEDGRICGQAASFSKWGIASSLRSSQ